MLCPNLLKADMLQCFSNVRKELKRYCTGEISGRSVACGSQVGRKTAEIIDQKLALPSYKESFTLSQRRYFLPLTILPERLWEAREMCRACDIHLKWSLSSIMGESVRKLCLHALVQA